MSPPQASQPFDGICNLIDGHSLLRQVDRIAGVVSLARAAVAAEAERNETLSDAWTALSLAREALQDLRYDLEGVPQARRWQEQPEATDEESAAHSGQQRYERVVAAEQVIKALLDEIPYESLRADPTSCQALDAAETHLRIAVSELAKVRAIEVPRLVEQEEPS